MLAEDDEGLRSVLERGLHESGYAVDAVADGDRASAYLRSYDYAAVILDWRMPKKSGLEVLAEARSRRMTTPVVMLTARDTTSDRVAGLHAWRCRIPLRHHRHGLRRNGRRRVRPGDVRTHQPTLRCEQAVHSLLFAAAFDSLDEVRTQAYLGHLFIRLLDWPIRRGRTDEIEFWLAQADQMRDLGRC